MLQMCLKIYVNSAIQQGTIEPCFILVSKKVLLYLVGYFHIISAAVSE